MPLPFSLFLEGSLINPHFWSLSISCAWGDWEFAPLKVGQRGKTVGPRQPFLRKRGWVKFGPQRGVLLSGEIFGPLFTSVRKFTT